MRSNTIQLGIGFGLLAIGAVMRTLGGDFLEPSATYIGVAGGIFVLRSLLFFWKLV
jgi:hypothetical protein